MTTEPDSIQITRASFANGWLEVAGTSNFAPHARMTVSVDGFVFEAPMSFAGSSRYEYRVPCTTSLKGRRVTISTDAGGAYYALIQ